MNTVDKAIRAKEQALAHTVSKRRDSVFDRFPLIFTMLSTFGVVATFYGFEGIIDQIDVLANHPLILLGTGVAVLTATGSLYKKLQ